MKTPLEIDIKQDIDIAFAIEDALERLLDQLDEHARAYGDSAPVTAQRFANAVRETKKTFRQLAEIRAALRGDA